MKQGSSAAFSLIFGNELCILGSLAASFHSSHSELSGALPGSSALGREVSTWNGTNIGHGNRKGLSDCLRQRRLPRSALYQSLRVGYPQNYWAASLVGCGSVHGGTEIQCCALLSFLPLQGTFCLLPLSCKVSLGPSQLWTVLLGSWWLLGCCIVLKLAGKGEIA